MDDYTVLGRIGEGAHGVVMKGRHKKSGSIVALKKVLIKRIEEGIPETALREIKALQVCNLTCTNWGHARSPLIDSSHYSIQLNLDNYSKSRQKCNILGRIRDNQTLLGYFRA